jgi:hypothetical protein
MSIWRGMMGVARAAEAAVEAATKRVVKDTILIVECVISG